MFIGTSSLDFELGVIGVYLCLIMTLKVTAFGADVKC